MIQQQAEELFVEINEVEFPPLNLSDITVDEEGRVIVANTEFSEALRAQLQSSEFLAVPLAKPKGGPKNGVCGNNC